MLDKFKLFIENFLVYGLGGIVSKIVPLIMVPIVTRIMPSSDYFGLSDLSNTVVQFASAFAVMGMYDAMYRMFFEKEEEEFKKDICSTALLFTLTMSLFVFFLLIVFKNQIALYFFGNTKYAYVVYISAIATLVGATNSIISAPTRMQNNRKIFLITNTVSPILSYSISIPLLLAGYYTVALPLAAVISGITMEISFGVLNRQWFAFNRFNVSLLKKLLIIAVPLFPNFLIYWVFNSCDKVMITNMIGIGATGIYSVGAKLGHASQLIYIAFAGGWQFFAFSTMKEDNQVKNNSLVFEYLGIISFVATSLVCVCSYTIFKWLFSQQYLEGYIVAPYLFFAPLLQMLFQVACNQFLVIKKTLPNMLILSVGAVVNIIMNLALIPVLGIEGASIATLIGYVVSDIVCVIVLYKFKLMFVSGKFIISCLAMLAFVVIWRLLFCSNIVMSMFLALVLIISYSRLYGPELKSLVIGLRNKKKVV